jgi:hypothetical protein
VSVEYTIFCDGCGAIIDANRTSVREARAAAKAQQGAIQRGPKDYCSVECVKDEAARTPKEGPRMCLPGEE